MADIESNINLNINATEALASIKALQREISTFHTELTKQGAAQAATSAKMTQDLVSSLNATGKFSAQMKTIATSTESFTNSLERNKFSMGEYFRYALASTKTFGNQFQGELETVNKVARERVKDLQTQYIQLGRDANGAMRAIAIRPTTLDLQDFGTQTQIAAQKHQLFNKLLDQGSTNLLNWGKNTQWAGRQLMVGFSVPLAAFAVVAGQSFMKLEQAAVDFKRVYGDAMTPATESTAMVEQIKGLAGTFTQYGVAVSDTMSMASKAAAQGATGQALMAQVAQTNKLAVLGGIDQEKSLETITSLTNTFGIATKDLANNIDFLNAVENQTVLNIDDMTTAIPIAAPVIQQLGGDVKDLSVMLTAMKEGGINASEGANALKSGMAALINPTEAATTALGDMGINLTEILDSNRGNAMGMIQTLASQLDKLDPTTRAQAIEQLFGKFQFARMSTLLQNINKEGTQAAKALQLTKASAGELAAISSKELDSIAESPAFKFKKAIQDFQAAVAPVGESFVKLATPLIAIGTNILNWFNGLNDTVKNVALGVVAFLGLVAPTALMFFGLVANGFANLIKMVAKIGNAFYSARNSTKFLGEQTQYLSQTQVEASSVAASLEHEHMKLQQRFTSEKGTAEMLIGTYEKMAAVQRSMKIAPMAMGGGTPGEAGEYGKPERSHLTMPFARNSSVYKETVASSRFAGLPQDYLSRISVVSNLIAELPNRLNQGLRAGGVSTQNFAAMWDSREGKLTSNLKRGKLDLNDEQIMAAAKEMETKIRDRAIALAKGTESQMVTDPILAQATKDVIKEYKAIDGAAAKVATVLEQQAAKAGQARLYIPTEEVNQKLKTGELVRDKRVVRHAETGIEIGRYDSETDATGWRPTNSSTTGSYASTKLLSTLATNADVTAGLSNKVRETLEKEAQIQAGILKLNEEELLEHNKRLRAAKGAITRANNAQAKAAANQETIAQLTQEEVAAEEANLASARRSKLTRGIGAAGMGIGIAGMALSTMGGPVGEIAGAVSGPLTMMSTVLTMMPNQIGLVVAALTGMISIFGIITGEIEKNKQAQRDQAQAVSSNTKAMEGFASVAGTSLAENPRSAAGPQLPAGEKSFGQSYFESDAGKFMLEGVRKYIDSGDLTTASAKVANQLSTAVANGLLSAEQANSISTELGKSLKNTTLSADIKGRMNSLIGPSGENIPKDPIKVSIAIAKDSQQQLEQVTKGIPGLTSVSDTSSPDFNAVSATAEATRQNEYVSKNAVDITAGFNSMYSQGQQLIATQDAANAAAVEQLVTEGKIAEAQKLQNDYAEKRKALVDQTSKASQEYLDKVDKMSTAASSTLTAESTKQLKETYKGTKQEGAMNSMADTVSGAFMSASSKIVFNAELQSGELTTDQMKSLFRMFDPKDVSSKQTLDLMAKIDTKMGSGTTSQMMALLPAFGDNKTAQANFVATIEANANGDSQKTLDSLFAIKNTIEANGGKFNMDVFFNQDGTAKQSFTDLQTQLNGLDAYFADGVKKEASVVFQAYGLDATQEAMDYFNSLSPSDQKTYVSAYLTVYKAIDANSAAGQAELRAWAEGNGGITKYKQTGYKPGQGGGGFSTINYDAIAKDQASQAAKEAVSASQSAAASGRTTPPPGGGGSGGGGSRETTTTTTKEPTSWIDDVVKKLRDVRSATTAMTDNFTNSWSAINGMFGSGASINVFGGLEQQMRQLGAGQDLISKITGMSKEDYEKYKNQLFNFDSAGNITSFKAMLGTIAAAMRAAQLGDFQNKQKATVQTTLDQLSAVKKLVSAGMSYADAYNVVSDAATASAIANENNATSINAVADAATQAAAATRGLANAQALSTNVKKFEDQKKIYDFLKEKAPNLTDAETSAILASQEMQNSILDMLSGNVAFDAAGLRSALQDAVNQANLDLNISKLTIAGMDKIFADGMSKAAEEFSAKKTAIDIKLKVDTAKWSNDLLEGKQKIEDLTNGPGGLDDLQANLDQIADKEVDINKKYDDRYRALDRIQAANQAIAAQQRSQLSIADALSSGDIGAAAKAAADARAQAAEQQVADTRRLVQEQQAIELAQLTGKEGLTRAQTEDKIRAIKREILLIEENTTEKAQYNIDLETRKAELAKKNLEIIIDGKTYTEEAFTAMQNQVDLAKTSSKTYQDSIKETVSIVEQLAKAWQNVGKETSGASSVIVANTTTTTTTTPAPTAAPTAAPVADYHTEDYRNEMARAVIRGQYGNGQARVNALGADYDWIQERVNDMVYHRNGYATGGMVANYLASGGFAKSLFQPRGTDTVPAMLTPGEFVVKKFAVDQFGANNLNAINNGTYEGSSVYNNTYSINVNVKSDSNPEQIARTVVDQIKNIDAQRIRGNRL